MEIGQALVARHEYAPPDRRADFQEEDMKLVDFSRLPFFRQCLFPFLISSVWKHLDAFLQLLATRQRIAHGGRNSRCTVFGLMAHIDRYFFQRPASSPSAMGEVVTLIVKGHPRNELPFFVGSLLLRLHPEMLNAPLGKMIWLSLLAQPGRSLTGEDVDALLIPLPVL